MTRRTLHRPGVTLTEVLVAMFVMAIGMISLLTLFPLGAMQVGQALRDDRCRQTALQADAYMRSHWRHQVVEVLNGSGSPIEPYYWAMDDVNLYDSYYTTATPVPNLNPNPKVNYGNGVYLNKFLRTTYQLPNGSNLPQTTPIGTRVSPTTTLRADIWYNWNLTPAVTPDPTTLTNYPAAYATAVAPTSVPSYPVLVDLLGEVNRATNFDKYWAAGSQFTSVPNFLLLPRRQLNVVNTSSSNALQIAGMTDDMSFEKNGAPTGGAILGRQGRYTWSAIVQRPRNDVRTIANLTILVFDGRPSLPTIGDEIIVNPVNAVTNTATTLSRTVRITVPARTSVDQPVLLRKGGWIMDGTIPTASPITPQMVNFYRISGFVEDSANPGTFDLDLETPLKADLSTTSQLYLFAGLAEVFERPAMKPDLGYYLP